ncbi:MAG TPA: hypothetical protein VEL76_18295 [Gemmataceae bacterium]|nr:hypothetical protein [Gemmataceae bacterium]
MPGGPVTPEAAFQEFQAAIEAKDGERAWKLLSKHSQAELNAAVQQLTQAFKMLANLPPEQRKTAEEQIAKVFGMSVAELQKMDGKGLLGFSLKNAQKLGKGSDALTEITTAPLENVKVEGDRATATVKTKTKSEPLRFIHEGGSWKITPPW